MINDDAIEFNSSNVFAALALFNQLTVPLFIFPITIPIIISCLISTKRIAKFLSQPEITKEQEGFRNMARILCKSSDSLEEDQISNDEHENTEEQPTSNKIFIESTIDEEESDVKLLMEIKINDHDVKISDDTKDFLTPDVELEEHDANCSENTNAIQDDVVILRDKKNKIKLRKQNQLSTSTRFERNRLRSTTAVDKHKFVDSANSIKTATLFNVPEELIVCIKNGRFSWDQKSDSNCLEVESLSIPKGMNQSRLLLTYQAFSHKENDKLLN